MFNLRGSKLDALLQVKWYSYFMQKVKNFKKMKTKSEPILELELSPLVGTRSKSTYSNLICNQQNKFRVETGAII